MTRREEEREERKTLICAAEAACVLTGMNSHRDIEHPPKACDAGHRRTLVQRPFSWRLESMGDLMECVFEFVEDVRTEEM